MESPVAGVTEVTSDTWDECPEPNLGPLKEEQAVLNAEPFLQAPLLIFKNCVCLSMHVCTCMSHVGMWLHAPMCMHVEARRGCQMSSSIAFSPYPLKILLEDFYALSLKMSITGYSGWTLGPQLLVAFWKVVEPLERKVWLVEASSWGMRWPLRMIAPPHFWFSLCLDSSRYEKPHHTHLSMPYTMPSPPG